MRKILSILTLIALLAPAAVAQQHMISVEPYGGLGYYIAGRGMHPTQGATAGVMLGYSHLWDHGDGFRLGLKTGLDLAYSGGGVRANLNEQFTNTDYLGLNMAYTVTGDVHQTVHSTHLAVPIMLALDLRGILVNVGLKPTFPLTARGQQDIADMHISAEYTDFGVVVTDELVTGLPREEQLHQPLSPRPAFSLWWTMEAGYSWRLRERHAVSVLAFLNLAPQQIMGSARQLHLVDVTPITNPEYPVADVQVGTMDSFRMDAVCYVDFGIKLVYGFCFGTE